MTDTLQGFDLLPEDDPSAQDKARRVVASNALDVDDARELLRALGLLSTTKEAKSA